MEPEWERDVKFHEDGICLEVVVVVALIVAKGVSGDVDGSGGSSVLAIVVRAWCIGVVRVVGGGRIVYRSGGGVLCRSG